MKGTCTGPTPRGIGKKKENQIGNTPEESYNEAEQEVIKEGAELDNKVDKETKTERQQTPQSAYNSKS